MHEKRKGYLLDVDYIVRKEKTFVRLLIRGKDIVTLYYRYDPYFYVDPGNAAEEVSQEISKIKVKRAGKEISVKKVEIVKMHVGIKDKKLLKVFTNIPADVPVLKHAIPFKCYEYSIPFAKRVGIDLGLTPLSLIKYRRKKTIIKQIDAIDTSKAFRPKIMAFDIETYNKDGTPDPGKDPIIMVSYATENEAKVITWKKSDAVKDVETVNGELEMLMRFNEIIKTHDPDIVIGYNSTNFDIPYMLRRAKELGIELKLGKTSNVRIIRRGLLHGIKLSGRIHFDLYPIIRFFGNTGIIQSESYKLKEVYENIFGKKPEKIQKEKIWQMWDSGNIETLVKYSLSDAKITYAVGKYVLPLIKEISQISKLQFFDTTISTSGQLVESLLMYMSHLRNKIIPRRPTEREISIRVNNPITGAFVKVPEPGIYENIAVLDFRGLYPSIITSYNIDPDTLINGKEEIHKLEKNKLVYKSPIGHIFLKKPKGLIPEVLDDLIKKRARIKRRLKEIDKNTYEYEALASRSQALKILSNSFYGYLVYARSRWYCRPCGETITALGRKHIKETIESAEEHGFKVLYGDTDSLFILIKDKSKEDIISFIKWINQRLPGTMELELEDFYSRGVFVSKKGDENRRGAKKKYALISESGNIKIRGFELVRRDWSEIARETQYKVLEAILKEGSKEKAVSIVRETIDKLRRRQIPKDKLIIRTQLNKDIKAYDVISPEVAAAKVLAENGVHVKRGSMIEYIITERGKSISEKSIPASMVKEGEYDPNYYINNQVLPSVLKILRELGYDEYALKEGGKQGNLSKWI